jgi:hypothetical protein
LFELEVGMLNAPQYTDSYYITTVINSLANTFVSLAVTEGSEFFSSRRDDPLSDPKLRLAVDEIERYMSMDRLVPSYHNVITLAGIEVSLGVFLVTGHGPGRAKCLWVSVAGQGQAHDGLPIAR